MCDNIKRNRRLEDCEARIEELENRMSKYEAEHEPIHDKPDWTKTKDAYYYKVKKMIER